MSKSFVPVIRERRYFSEAARRSIVEEIDNGLSKAEASRKYEVSQSAIYVWMNRYSKLHQTMLVKVVEHASESNKVKKLEAQIEQVYAMLGRVKADFLLLQTVVEKADESLGTDLKKNFDSLRWPNSTTKKTKLT